MTAAKPPDDNTPDSSLGETIRTIIFAMIIALTKAVRVKNKPAPAASNIAPDPYAQTSRQGSEAGNGSNIGAKSP